MLSANLGCKLNQIKAAITKACKRRCPRYTVHGRVQAAHCSNSKRQVENPRKRPRYCRPLNSPGWTGFKVGYLVLTVFLCLADQFLLCYLRGMRRRGASSSQHCIFSATSWQVYFYCLSPPLSQLSYRSIAWVTSKAVSILGGDLNICTQPHRRLPYTPTSESLCSALIRIRSKPIT